MIKRVISLSLLTYREGIRDRALVGISLFSLIMMGSSLFVVSMFMRELQKVAVDINLSAITMACLLLTFFVSINLMAKDIDKHTIYCVLSKPISRTEYIFAKFLGIMFLVASAFFILTLCSTIIIYVIKIHFSTWFKVFQWPLFFKAVYSEFLMFIVLNAIVVFFSTITTSSFITLLFSISAYVSGQTIEEVVAYLRTQPDIILSKPINEVINICQYILPNLSAFDLKIKAAYALPVSWTYLFAITGYSIIYSLILLILSSIIFSKRELV